MLLKQVLKKVSFYGVNYFQIAAFSLAIMGLNFGKIFVTHLSNLQLFFPKDGSYTHKSTSTFLSASTTNGGVPVNTPVAG